MDNQCILVAEVALLWASFSPLLPLLTAPRRDENEPVPSTVPRLACTLAATVATTVAASALRTAIAVNKRESIASALARGFAGLAVGILAVHAATVVLGAPFVRQVPETLLFSALMAAMTFLPVSVTSRQPWQACVEFLLGSRSVAYEPGAIIPAAGCALGAWLGAIPLSLDWERPWQDWPLPMCVGGLLGFTASALLLSGIHFAEKLWRKLSPAAWSSKRV